MAKNNTSIHKVVKIIIKPYTENKHTWHIKTEVGRGSNKTIEETILPKDIFGNAISNYITLINVLRLLNESTNPLRKSIEESIKKMKESQEKPPEPEKKVTLTKHQIKEQEKVRKRSLLQAKSQVSFLDSSTDALRKNLSSESMVEKVALALALTEKVSYEDIDEEITNSRNEKFEIDIPITKYPDLGSMQSQNSGQFFSIIENMFSIGGALARGMG